MSRNRKRKLKRAISLAQSGQTVVHDRRSTDLLINARVASRTVDDPLELGGKLNVLVSVRDDPLAQLYARRFIDDAQFMAGRKWQELYELAESGAMRSGLSEFVDGRGTDGLGIDSRLDAFVELLNCHDMLGKQGEALVRSVLGHGKFIIEVAADLGLNSQRDIDYLGRRLRECLESIAEVFGFSGSKAKLSTGTT